MERGWAISLTAPPAGSCFADILLPTVEALQQQQQEPPAAAKPPYLPPAVTAGVAPILSARCCHINFLDVLHSFPEVLNPSKKLPLLLHFPQWRHSSTQWRHSSSSRSHLQQQNRPVCHLRSQQGWQASCQPGVAT